jgi:hypothetical protein
LDFGLNENEAAFFLHKMNSSATIVNKLITDKTKKRSLSRNEKKLIKLEQVRYKIALEIDSGKNGLLLNSLVENRNLQLLK